MLSIASCASAEDAYVTKPNPLCLGSDKVSASLFEQKSSKAHRSDWDFDAGLRVVESALR